MSHHVIEARHLAFQYPDGTPALQGVSFRITHGECVALIGPNGAGKSTLLLHLTGCLWPSRGELRVGDVPVSRQTLPHIRRTVGLVFQDPDDQLFMPTVADDLAFGPLNLGLRGAEVEGRIRACLERVGAAHLRERPPYRLSAGEKRAVAIAAVLSLGPSILALDEPSSHLDPRHRRQLIGLLRSFEHTRLVATHDLDLALDVCSRVILLAQGTVAADGPATDVLADGALLERHGLEKPLRLQGCPRCGAA
ncbi:MAG: ABC transporter ATP-binding protein [Candidatus Latescibacterota bacterium]